MSKRSGQPGKEGKLLFSFFARIKLKIEILLINSYKKWAGLLGGKEFVATITFEPFIVVFEFYCMGL